MTTLPESLTRLPLDHRWDGDLCLFCSAQASLPGEAEDDHICPGQSLLSYDTETHLRQPGLPAPPLVCGSTATQDNERLHSKEEARVVYRQALEDPRVTITGSSLDYDNGVMCADDPSLVDLVFQALEDGRMIDTGVMEKLHSNGKGQLEEYGGNSQAELEARYTGIDRSQEKENGWRFKYALLEDVPTSEWPDDAVQYPRRDARGGFDVSMRQLGITGYREHDWKTSDTCALCGQDIGFGGPECPLGKPAPRLNLQCVVQETYAAWCLRLISIWGMRTDPVMVPVVVADIRKKHEESRRKFFDVGIVRVRPCNKKKDKDTGLSEWEREDEISAEWLAEARARLDQMAGGHSLPPLWVERRLDDITKCERALAKGRPIRFAEDKGWLKELVTAAYKGDPPMTAGGEKGSAPAVSTSRDTLVECGDPLLEEYGEAGPNEKLLSTYVPVLEQGTVMPICPGFNSTLSTQRVSLFDPNLTQLPRGGLIRSCFVPRDENPPEAYL